jgi:hypothetical protein
MKKIMKKIKKMCEWIWNNIHSVIIIIGSFFLFLFAIKEYNQNRVKKQNWKSIPGTKIKVKVKNKGKWEEIDLPTIHGKQITTDDIENIGMTERGEYAIKKKHTPTDRRNIVSTDNNNSSMDI